VAAALAVEHLLLAGKLPEETACVLCGVETPEVVHYWVACERAVPFRRRWVELNPASALTLWFGHLAVTRVTQSGEHGRDARFDLPLRVCPGCKERVRGADVIKEALSRVPLYRRLLEEYPEASVSTGATAPRTGPIP
jgi:hypothetical protein